MNPIVVLILLVIITGSAVFFTKKRGMKQQDELVEAIIEETVTELVDGEEADAAVAPAVLGRSSRRNSLAAKLRRAARRARRAASRS